MFYNQPVSSYKEAKVPFLLGLLPSLSRHVVLEQETGLDSISTHPTSPVNEHGVQLKIIVQGNCDLCVLKTLP